MRVPLGLVLGVALPALFLVIFNAIPALKKPAPGSTLTLFAEYIPVLICLSLCLIALVSLPIPLVNNRQMGVLRRFSTTPAPQSWLLAAQVIINLVLAVTAIVILVAGGALLFGVHPASQLAGFVVSVALATAAMFAIQWLLGFLAGVTEQCCKAASETWTRFLCHTVPPVIAKARIFRRRAAGARAE